MKKYNCTISEKDREDFVSVFEVTANNKKEALSFAKMQKTKRGQKIELSLIKS